MPWLNRFASLFTRSARTERARGRAGRGRRKAGKGSAHGWVGRRALTEDTGMRRATFVVSVAAVMMLAAAEASPAAAAQPWWQLSASARPTNLSADSGKDEVQKLTVTATGGEYLIANLEGGIEALPFDADAVEVKEKVELAYPARAVQVREEPTVEPDTRVFDLTFPSQFVKPPPFVTGESFGQPPLTGPGAQAGIEQLQAGENSSNEVILSAANLGDVPTAEAPTVSLVDSIPPGLEPVVIEAFAGQPSGAGNRGPVTCHLTSLICTFSGTLPPYDEIEVRIKVRKLAGAGSGEENRLRVTGGGAPPVEISRPLVVSDQAPSFGVESYELRSEAEGGAAETQAGSHPFQLNTTIAMNQLAAAEAGTEGGAYEARPAGPAKDLDFRWPAGLIGNPSPLPRCTIGQFLTASEQGNENINACPPQTAVGVAMVTVDEPATLHLQTLSLPLFNLEPAAGEPARLGFLAIGEPILIDPAVRSGAPGEPDADYGLDISTTNITQIASFLSARVVVWGTPGDPSHDNSRGWGCLADTRALGVYPCPASETSHPPAFITTPTSCAGSGPQATVDGDSWSEPTTLVSLMAPPLPTLDGCNRLPFLPTIKARADLRRRHLSYRSRIRPRLLRRRIVEPGRSGPVADEKAVVTLPQGFTTNPSVAEGLKACGEGEYDAATVQVGTGCTEESKIGEVEIESAARRRHEDHRLPLRRQAGRKPQPQPPDALPDRPQCRNRRADQTGAESDPEPGHRPAHHRSRRHPPAAVQPLPPRASARASAARWSPRRPAAPTRSRRSSIPTPIRKCLRERESSFQITQGPEGRPCPQGTPALPPGPRSGHHQQRRRHLLPLHTRSPARTPNRR